MKFADLFNVAITSIVRNGTRSLLTVLGIVIGVGAVIGMMAIGKGSEDSIKGELAALGTNMITISPGAQRQGGASRGSGTTEALFSTDIPVIKKYCPSVLKVSPVVVHSSQVIAGTNNSRSTIYGVETDYLAIQNHKIRYGQKFDDATGKSLRKVCLIGKTVAENLFSSSSVAVGQIIRIDKTPFRIIGVLKEKGQTFGMDQDDIIIAPFETVQKRLKGVNFISSIMVSSTSEATVELAVEEINDVLLNRLNKKSGGEPTFNIRTQKEMMSVMGNVLGMITLLLAAVAAISLLVGGIGIMNIMLVSVTERTREIGLRLAVGAQKSAILWQFLVESIMLCLIGGILGILLGYGIASLAGGILKWAVVITPWSVIIAFGFSFFIGVVFGFFPARKASRLNPIQALRFE